MRSMGWSFRQEESRKGKSEEITALNFSNPKETKIQIRKFKEFLKTLNSHNNPNK